MLCTFKMTPTIRSVHHLPLQSEHHRRWTKRRYSAPQPFHYFWETTRKWAWSGQPKNKTRWIDIHLNLSGWLAGWLRRIQKPKNPWKTNKNELHFSKRIWTGRNDNGQWIKTLFSGQTSTATDQTYFRPVRHPTGVNEPIVFSLNIEWFHRTQLLIYLYDTQKLMGCGCAGLH